MRCLLVALLLLSACGDEDGDSRFELACSVIIDGADVEVNAPNDGETTGPDINLDGSPDSHTEFCTISDGTIEVTDSTADFPAGVIARKIWAVEGCGRVTHFPNGTVVFPPDAEECDV